MRTKSVLESGFFPAVPESTLARWLTSYTKQCNDLFVKWTILSKSTTKSRSINLTYLRLDLKTSS